MSDRSHGGNPMHAAPADEASVAIAPEHVDIDVAMAAVIPRLLDGGQDSLEPLELHASEAIADRPVELESVHLQSKLCRAVLPIVGCLVGLDLADFLIEGYRAPGREVVGVSGCGGEAVWRTFEADHCVRGASGLPASIVSI